MGKYSENKLIANRISSLRVQQGWTQQDLVDELCKAGHRRIAKTTVSAWETGRKLPSYDTLMCLSTIFNVTQDYILCRTNDRNTTLTNVGAEEKKKIENIVESRKEIQISIESLSALDGLPVFLGFNNYAHEDQWAIINCTKGAFVCRNGFIAFNDPVVKTIYINEPDYHYHESTFGRVPLSMSKLMSKKEQVWVEMITSDSNISARYNGWYRHNEDRSCLISGLGLTLPYDGLGVSYYAYANYNQLDKYEFDKSKL